MSAEISPLDTEDNKTPVFWKITQLFVVPASIVLVCVGIYTLFKFMTGETSDPYRLLDLIKTGDKHSRKIYLHEFVYAVEQLTNNTPDDKNKELRRKIALKTSGVIDSFIGSKGEKKIEIQTLIKILGRLRDKVSGKLLVKILDGQPDDEIKLACLEALGALKDREYESLFKKYAANDNSLLRYHAIFGLSALEIPENEDYIMSFMENDKEESVRLNAAHGLAYFYRNRIAMRYLCNMLDSDKLRDILGVRNSTQMPYVENAMLRIMQTIYLLREKGCIDSLKKLLNDDSISSRSRSSAIELVNILEESDGK